MSIICNHDCFNCPYPDVPDECLEAPLQGSAGLPAAVVPGMDYIRDGGGRLGREGADETTEEV